MVGSFLAALIFVGQSAPPVGKYEVGERIKELDRVWLSTTDRARRSAAIPKISQANVAMLAGRYSDACRAFDDATAALQSRANLPEDAITLRFDPPFVEPRSSAKLRIGWAYAPQTNRTVRVQVGRQTVIATPGRALTIEVRPDQLNPELLQNPEVGYLMPVQVGAEQRTVFLSIIKRPKERLRNLLSTKVPEAQTLVQFLGRAFENPDDLEGELPLIQYLFTAELLDEGRLRLDRADTLPLVKHRGTHFRAMFPRQVRGPLTVVIGLPDSHGSENTFFEAYGQGMAVTQATRRNWAFVSPRASENSIEDVLDWIRNRRKQPIQRIYIMAHSSASVFALKSASINPAPSGIAIFAPSSSALPSGLENIPIFASVGRQDSIAANLKGLGQALGARRNSEFEEVDPCEHLMVVADSLNAAYRFFDAHGGR